MSSNKNITYQPDVKGSDKFHCREHTDPKPSPSLSRVTSLPVQNLSIATSPQLLLLFKLQSIQTLRFCDYMITQFCVFAELSAAIKDSDS